MIIRLALVFGLWIAVLAGVTRYWGAAPALVVLFPGAALMAHLPPDVALTGATAISATFRSTEPGLAARLYGAGALLVLPAGLTGCATPPRV